MCGIEVMYLNFNILVGASSETNLNELEVRHVKVKQHFDRIPRTQIELSEEIGSGQFGKVYTANLKGYDKKVAVKMLRPSSTFTTISAQTLEDFRTEVIVHELLGNHPNVVTYHGANDADDEEPYIVMDYYQNGSLKENTKLPETKVQDVAIGALRGLLHVRGVRARENISSFLIHLLKRGTNSYTIHNSSVSLICNNITRMLQNTSFALHARMQVHESGYLHRDVASRNFLLDDTYQAHICDFGLSTFRPKNSLNGALIQTRRQILPIKNAAPEAKPFSKEDVVFSRASDVWSAGLVVWDIHGCEMKSSIASQRISEGGTVQCPRRMNQKTFKAIEKCWSMDPSKRPSVCEFLAALEL